MEPWPTYVTGIVAILLFSAFVKCITTFSILRFGIGLHGPGFGLAMIALALGLTWMTLAPQLEQSGGLDALLRTPFKSMAELERRFGPMLEKHTQPEVRDRFTAMALRLRPQAEGQGELGAESRFSVLAAAFLVSQVTEAFQIGFLILIPFLVIDLLIANVLLLLGAVQVPQAVIALPVKILLFFSLNGWTLLSEKLMGSYV